MSLPSGKNLRTLALLKCVGRIGALGKGFGPLPSTSIESAGTAPTTKIDFRRWSPLGNMVTVSLLGVYQFAQPITGLHIHAIEFLLSAAK